MKLKLLKPKKRQNPRPFVHQLFIRIEKNFDRPTSPTYYFVLDGDQLTANKGLLDK